MRASLVALSLLLISLAGAGMARADVAPRDACTAPGQPCQNAMSGGSYNQPGVCTPTTCTKQLRGADGGFTPITYACNLCELTDAGTTTGAAGASPTGGSAGAAGGASGSAGAMAGGGAPGTGGSSKTGGGSSGCGVAPGTPARDGAAILVVLMAVGLAAVRRRRHAAR